MRSLLPVLTAVLLVTGSVPAAAQSPDGACETHDLMPAFWTFWESARDATDADQVRLFRDGLQVSNAAVYDGILRGLPLTVDQLVPRAVGLSRPLEGTIRSLSGQLPRSLPALIARFKATFPDFRCTTPVYFLFAAGAFDGATREVGGRSALLFGLDVIAQMHGDRLGPLVAHELFHVHHANLHPLAPDAFYWSLWREGLATYVSRRLHPEVPEQQVCCLPPIDAVQSALPRMMPEVSRLLDSGRQEDQARFFIGGATDIPQRSGYYVGYRLAEILGAGRSLQDLARLTPAEVRVLIEVSLGAVR